MKAFYSWITGSKCGFYFSRWDRYFNLIVTIVCVLTYPVHRDRQALQREMRGLRMMWTRRSSQIHISYELSCEVCGKRPVIVKTGLCEPCTFGEAA